MYFRHQCTYIHLHPASHQPVCPFSALLFLCLDLQRWLSMCVPGCTWRPGVRVLLPAMSEDTSTLRGKKKNERRNDEEAMQCRNEERLRYAYVYMKISQIRLAGK